MSNDNKLATVSERHMAIAESLGGGQLTLTCRGDFGIAPFFLTIGGRPVTGIATLFDPIEAPVAKWVHNDTSSARAWLIDNGADPELADTLLEDLAARMDEVTS